MPVIEGQVCRESFGGAFNPRLTPALDSFDVDYWPPHDTITHSRVGVTASEFPVSAAGRQITGAFGRTFSDDFYHRIHIRPRVLELGNMVSTQVQEIEVWNSYLTPVLLNSIDGIEEGISFVGPDDFPLVFNGLQLLTWDVSVTPNGPTQIDVTLTWDFASVPDARLRITGTRIVAWAFVPDWGRSVRERLQWLTDIPTSDERHEQRRAMRIGARRIFDAQMIIDGRERVLYDLMMHGWGGRVWALPIWPDVQLLRAVVADGALTIQCETAGRDFRVGGLALLRSESAFVSEVAEIESITSTHLTLVRPTQDGWPIGTRLYPARTAVLLEQPKDRRLTDQACIVDARFLLVEPSDWPEETLPTYRGLAVFDARPDESEDLTGTFERMFKLLDSGSGVPLVFDAADAPFRVQGHAWKLNGVTEHGNFRSLLHALRGRQVSVWVPTHADDLHVTQTIGELATTMQVELIGYSRFGFGQLGRRDIRIELRNGTVFMRRITASIVLDAETEQLSIDVSLGQEVEPGEIARISFMMPARLQHDEVDIEHATDAAGVATSRLMFVAVRDDEAA